MRRLFVVSLIATIVFSSAYLYQLVAAICPIPITYQVGELDERFSLSRAEAEAVVEEAAAIWQMATPRTLFVPVSDGADLTINFVFDDRQARAVAEAELREVLDERGQTTESLADQYTRLNREYEQLQQTYRDRVTQYETRLSDYNREVASYNAAGGAPPAVFEQLKDQEESLAAEMRTLQQLSQQLEQLVTQLNQLAEEGNDLIAEYNEGVLTYNQTFGESAEFTQGDFQGTTIQIYKFTNRTELITVLAHELGHALGIGHVEGEASIMYYLMGAQPEPPVLSDMDQAALLAVCGTEEGWRFWWYRLLTLYT